jgi:hypothetical protein
MLFCFCNKNVHAVLDAWIWKLPQRKNVLQCMQLMATPFSVVDLVNVLFVSPVPWICHWNLFYNHMCLEMALHAGQIFLDLCNLSLDSLQSMQKNEKWTLLVKIQVIVWTGTKPMQGNTNVRILNGIHEDSRNWNETNSVPFILQLPHCFVLCSNSFMPPTSKGEVGALLFSPRTSGRASVDLSASQRSKSSVQNYEFASLTGP